MWEHRVRQRCLPDPRIPDPTANECHVTASGDPAVEVDYAIKVTGYSDVRAMGSADAYVNAHIQEGRGDSDPNDAEDPTYSKYTTAAGDTTSLAKDFFYQSGLHGY